MLRWLIVVTIVLQVSDMPLPLWILLGSGVLGMASGMHENHCRQKGNGVYQGMLWHERYRALLLQSLTFMLLNILTVFFLIVDIGMRLELLLSN